MSDERFFIEQRPEGDYAVRKPDSKRASAVAPTQKKAIEQAMQIYPNATVLVERVRNTNVGRRISGGSRRSIRADTRAD